MHTSPIADDSSKPSYLSQAKQILKELEASPLKRLGQNFMIRQSALERVSTQIKASQQDLIIEIGPGLGFLTEHLAQNKSPNTPLIAIELDKKYANYLMDQFSDRTDVTIFHQDIMKFDFEQQIQSILGHDPKPHSISLIGNIPYQISSPLLDIVLKYRLWWSEVYFTVQKDFAKRLVTLPGNRDCGAISVWVGLNADCKIICDFPGDFFYPRPKVKSSLIQILPKPVSEMGFDANESQSIDECIHSAFGHRRKTLSNSLLKPDIGWDKAKVCEALEQCSIPAQTRAEALSAEKWICLGKALMIE
ncbi:MAG: 16S rRNA (adenine1518-N6/adenine1519-N6)-dimethyltransferase [Candidatus Omnitrophota bacterium]|jgi:16S rRNA (adenine1518-N6/adenine1519-N6)-dimethyltransferase